MTPFILQGRKKLPPESEPSDDQVYDAEKQLWIDKKVGAPVVTLMTAPVQQSQFGETTITETREGADQSEVSSFGASQFGETTVTKTFEGADQTEATAFHQREMTIFAASNFDDTQITVTGEGHDQSELTTLSPSQFGETTVTRTSEGHDQTESIFATHSPLPPESRVKG